MTLPNLWARDLSDQTSRSHPVSRYYQTMKVQTNIICPPTPGLPLGSIVLSNSFESFFAWATL